SAPSCQKRPSASRRMPLWRSRSICSSVSCTALNIGRRRPAASVVARQVQDRVFELQLRLFDLGALALLFGAERQMPFQLGEAVFEAGVFGAELFEAGETFRVQVGHRNSLVACPHSTARVAA